jgi:hypothetical protein
VLHEDLTGVQDSGRGGGLLDHSAVAGLLHRDRGTRTGRSLSRLRRRTRICSRTAGTARSHTAGTAISHTADRTSGRHRRGPRTPANSDFGPKGISFSGTHCPPAWWPSRWQYSTDRACPVAGSGSSLCWPLNATGPDRDIHTYFRLLRLT